MTSIVVNRCVKRLFKTTFTIFLSVLSTHWFEVTVSRRSDGQVLFHNAWITDHFPQANNIVELVNAPRSRWKTGNENHNTLKTVDF